MTIEEFTDSLKTLFDDYKFIDNVVQFCRDSDRGDENAKMETDYKTYVNQDNINILNEMVHKLPLITSKDVNVSSQMYLTIQDNKNRKLLEDEMLKLTKKSQAQTGMLSKSDPYLQKLIEMLYVNIKSRF